MNVAALWLRREWHRRGLAYLAVAVIGGLALGFSMVVATGARRTESAYDRLRAETLAPHVIISATSAVPRETLDELAEAPGIAGLGAWSYTPVVPEPLVAGVDGGSFIALDEGFGVSVYRPVAVSGRLADPSRPDEVTVNETMARLGGFEAGDRVRLVGGWENDQSFGEATVVGVHRGIFDVGANAGQPNMLLGEPFFRAHEDELITAPAPAIMARLDDGAAGVDGARAVFDDILGAGGYSLVPFGALDPTVDSALSVQRTVLLLLAAAALLATLVVVAQTVARLAAESAVDRATLMALGLHRTRLRRLDALTGVAVSVPMVAVAVVGGALGSAFVPVGFAATVDPAEGAHPDVAVLAGGSVLALVVLVVAAAANPARRRESVRQTPVKLRSRFPLPLRIGSGWAFPPVREPAGSAVRSALGVVAVGTVALVGVTVFVASRDRAVDTPSRFGWTFDLAVVGYELPLDDLRAEAVPALEGPDIERFTFGIVTTVGLPGGAVEAFALGEGSGEVHPTIASGAPPRADDELALGLDLAQREGLAVGSTVDVATASGTHRLRVSGIGVYPEIGDSSDLANAASLTLGGARRLGLEPYAAMALVQLAPGADADAVTGRLAIDGAELVRPFAGPRVRNLSVIGSVPQVFAGFVTVLGGLAVAHALVRSGRLRRREVGVLRAVGFRPADLRWAVAWQGASMVLVPALLAAPLGVLAGRVAWGGVARSAGVIGTATLSVTWAVVVLALLLVAAEAVCLGAGAAAVRRRPAAALRSPE